MAAPANDSSSTTAATTAGQDEPLLVKTTMPLPRAIQLVAAISSGWKSSTTTSSTKTVEEAVGGRPRVFVWIILGVVVLSMCIAAAACYTYTTLRDGGSGSGGEPISDAGVFGILAVFNLLCLYLAVVQAAWAHLGFFALRMPCAACDALFVVGLQGMSLLLLVITIGVVLPYLMLNQAWPLALLVAWAFLLGLLVASTVALWLCLHRTYGGDGGERRREDRNCGGAVIDSLAYPYSRLLYEVAVRFFAVAVADAGVQQLDAAYVAV